MGGTRLKSSDGDGMAPPWFVWLDGCYGMFILQIVEVFGSEMLLKSAFLTAMLTRNEGGMQTLLITPMKNNLLQSTAIMPQ